MPGTPNIPDAKRIRVKAMGVITHEDKLLAQEGHDSASGEVYLRLLGGSIEFGETSEEALRRELREEIGAEASRLNLLTVLENRFTYKGRDKHEIIFIYQGGLAGGEFQARDVIPFIEANSTNHAVWTPLAHIIEGRAMLYPAADWATLLTSEASLGLQK